MNQTMCNLEILSDFYPRSQPAGIFHFLEELFYPFPVSRERVTVLTAVGPQTWKQQAPVTAQSKWELPHCFK